MKIVTVKKQLIITSVLFAIVLLATSVVLTNPRIAFGQSSANTNIFLTSDSLRAGESFSVGLTSSDIDLDRADISWFINGKLGLSGTGKKGFSSFAGPVGTTLIIRARITAPNGRIINKSTVVSPQEIDLLWRAYSHTPPFYEGRSLASPASFVSITAMPHVADSDGTLLKSDELIYTWKQYGLILGDASGFGKQTIVLENGQTEKGLLSIQVDVSNIENTVQTTESIVIPLTENKIIFYEDLPLEGVSYHRALLDEDLIKEELSIVAVPYYFSHDDVNNEKLKYKWKSNGKSISNPNLDNPNELVVRKSEGEGMVNIELEILNNNLPFRIFQKAKEVLRLNI